MDLIIGLLIVLTPVGAAGYVVGRLHGRHRRRPSTATYVCDSCGDPYGEHDPDTGHCHARKRSTYNGMTKRWEPVQCTCRIYVGAPPPDYTWTNPHMPSPPTAPATPATPQDSSPVTPTPKDHTP